MIRLIGALDLERGIAKHGYQPWSIPKDEQHFTRLTQTRGGEVLMGRTTFETLTHPLKDRHMVVLSHGAQKNHHEHVTFITDLRAYLMNAQKDVWVIGGESLYNQTIDLADELYLTQIEARFACDQFFPEYKSRFELHRETDLHTQNGFLFSYMLFTKK
jgi:dihydrofolate reductase